MSAILGYCAGAVRLTAQHMPAPLESMLRRGYPLALAASAERLPLKRWHGTLAGGVRATMLVAGPEPWSGYLAQRLFGGEAEREPLGAFRPWSLEAALTGEAADVTVIRSDWITARLLFRTDCLRVPAWVSVRCPSSVGLAAPARSRSVSRDLQRLRSGGFSTEISRGDAGLEGFYHEMYVPLMRERHGESAIARDLPWLRKSLARGGMIWVVRDGLRVAGVGFELSEGLLRLTVAGVRGGRHELFKGVLTGAYFGAFGYACEQGLAQIDLGGTRPSPADGLTRYKAKWGSTVSEVPKYNYCFLVRWTRWNPSVAALLASTPLMYRGADGLCAVAAVQSTGAATQKDADGLRRLLWIDGLHRLTIVSDSGWLDGVVAPPDTRLITPGNGGPLPESL
jgi:hypothetical protein